MKRILLLTILLPVAWCQQPSVSLNYVLGPGDQITLVIPALAEDFSNKSFRIDGSGDVSLPVIGSLHGGGRTVEAIQDEVKERLSSILQKPDVVVNIAQFSSQPVSVLGAVSQPGIRQLEGHKTLFEVLSLCGGLRTDAGTTIEITRSLQRGRIPLPNATMSQTGQFSVAVVKLKNITNASAENIRVLPGDTVFVAKAGVVYAVGSLTKPGGYVIGEEGVLSALQVVSLAGGFQKSAAVERARILRLVPGSSASRTEIRVNIKRLMAGETPDISLEPNDILFVPNSKVKSAGFRTMEAIVTVATGLTVYGRL